MQIAMIQLSLDEEGSQSLTCDIRLDLAQQVSSGNTFDMIINLRCLIMRPLEIPLAETPFVHTAKLRTHTSQD